MKRIYILSINIIYHLELAKKLFIWSIKISFFIVEQIQSYIYSLFFLSKWISTYLAL